MTSPTPASYAELVAEAEAVLDEWKQRERAGEPCRLVPATSVILRMMSALEVLSRESEARAEVLKAALDMFERRPDMLRMVGFVEAGVLADMAAALGAKP